MAGHGPLCPVEGCRRIRRAGQIMCKPHWRNVHVQTRSAATKAWEAWRGCDEDAITAKEYERLYDTYRSARREAIEQAGA